MKRNEFWVTTFEPLKLLVRGPLCRNNRCLRSTFSVKPEHYQYKPAAEDVTLIRRADLENHNKDGGMWVVLHGKVYDVQDFKTQAPCSSALLAQFAGEREGVSEVQNLPRNRSTTRQVVRPVH